MRFLISFGFVLHLLFLVSIFYIYFRSPILTDLAAQNDLKNPPAKRYVCLILVTSFHRISFHRLVIFVADGLRAESLYEVHLNRTPFLAEIILNKGISGISHTRVPVRDSLHVSGFDLIMNVFPDRISSGSHCSLCRVV